MPKKVKEAVETKEVETKELNKQGLVPGAIISNEEFMKVMNKQRAKEKKERAK